MAPTIQNQWKLEKVCSSKHDAAFTSSQPTKFVMYNLSYANGEIVGLVHASRRERDVTYATCSLLPPTKQLGVSEALMCLYANPFLRNSVQETPLRSA